MDRHEELALRRPDPRAVSTGAQEDRAGIAIQAYLDRTAKDIETLIPLGAAIRIVKGAYLEPPSRRLSTQGGHGRELLPIVHAPHVGGSADKLLVLYIATHDVPLADRSSAWIAGHDVPSSAYEFAMLYGIQRQQQLRLAREGKRLRVLISYGEFWFPGHMRRLAVMPVNVRFVVKNLGSQGGLWSRPRLTERKETVIF